jgi:hypothetical protein
MIFKCKEGTYIPICECGEELDDLCIGYYDSDTIECNKCHREYSLKDYKVNTTTFINSLLTLFPKDIILEEPSLKEGEEDFGKKLDIFFLYNEMMVKIRDWKKKADYYEKIQRYASQYTQDSYWYLLNKPMTDILTRFMTDLVFSISYENNKLNEEIQIY